MMTIPAIINKINDAELKTSAKKAYSVANQAYKLAIVDNGGGFGPWVLWETTAYEKFSAIKSKLNIIKECPFNSGSFGKCWADKAVGASLAGDCTRFIPSNQNKNEAFVTADGMYWMFYNYTATTGQAWLAVDVNGNKKPNDWGKDVFVFEIDDTVLRPMTYTCSNQLTHNDGTIVYTKKEFSAPFLH